jgi:1-acyl-sn-glycerol-3-phosphate acyltransferase
LYNLTLYVIIKEMSTLNSSNDELSPIPDTGWYDTSLTNFKRFRSLLRRDLHVEGRENVPAREPLIFAGSHHEGFRDTPAMVLALEGIRLRFMAAEDFFHIPIISWMFRDKWGAIPVMRTRMDREQIALHKAVQTLHYKEDPNLAIFPEGKMKDGSTIEKIEKGIGLIACYGEARIIPVGISSKGSFNFNPGLCDLWVKIGEPIDYIPLDAEYEPGSFTRSRLDKQRIDETTENIRIGMQNTLNEANQMMSFGRK